MNKHINYLVLLFLVVFHASCYNNLEDSDEMPSTDEITLKARINSYTRVKNNLFETNDQIGFFLFPYEEKQPPHLNNTPFFFSESNYFRTEDEVYYPSNKKDFKVIAYYPYTMDNKIDINKQTLKFQLLSNQESPKNRAKSDFLIAKREQVQSSRKALELKFNHVLSKIRIALKITPPYTVNDLAKIKPQVKLINFPTTGEYNISTSTITNTQAHKDITLSNIWHTEGDELVGVESIIIPTTDYSKQKIQIEAEHVVYECNLPSNLVINGGTENKIVINYTPTKGIEVGKVTSTIGDWKHGEEIDLYPTPLDTAIPLSALNFKESNVLNILNEEGLLRGVITLELLKNDHLENQAIILYPTKLNRTLREGIILDINHPNKEQFIASKIEWSDDKFTLTPSNDPYIRYIFSTKEGDLVFEEPLSSEIITIRNQLVYDSRVDELLTYPIVKIANKLWMRSNLATKYFLNDTPMASGKNDIVIQPGYAIFDHTPTEKLYNMALIRETLDFCPKGWRLPSDQTYNTLQMYINKQSQLLFSKTETDHPKANLSGLDIKLVGAHTQTQYAPNYYVFWLKNSSHIFCAIFNNLAQSKLMALDANDNAKVSKRMASIRCIKDAF